MFVISIIALSNKVPLLLNKLWILNLKGSWTTYVYILHPAFIIIVRAIFNEASIDDYPFVPYIMPILVVTLSVTSAILLNWIIVITKEKLSSRKQVVE